MRRPRATSHSTGPTRRSDRGRPPARRAPTTRMARCGRLVRPWSVALLMTIRKIQVLSDDRPSNRSRPLMMPSHASCTTSSAASFVATYARATRTIDAWYSIDQLRECLLISLPERRDQPGRRRLLDRRTGRFVHVARHPRRRRRQRGTKPVASRESARTRFSPSLPRGGSGLAGHELECGGEIVEVAVHEAEAGASIGLSGEIGLDGGARAGGGLQWVMAGVGRSPSMLAGSKNSIGESVPAVTLTKASMAGWLPWMAPRKPLHLRRWRLECRQLRGELVNRHRLCVGLRSGSAPRRGRTTGHGTWHSA